MNRQEIYDWFAEHMGFIDDPNFASYPPERRALKFGAQFLSACDHFYDSAITVDSSDDLALVNVFQELYDKYFVPIDLPMNNVMERMVEGYGRSFIGLGVSGLAAAIQKRNIPE